ncbi:bifunctional DNA-formamidopyrimidine glycosylase/DNA-(apurinic or apyrimidinic site) lyase [Mycoplasmopsis pullorum]|uniref:bifunctional DNA-formamidopyrimidine glycosylase/DNA-(apurinic or apyrimidinic site) lyase n=1 Tax=Mycoplasmopsis pullorum TaxID=48003 RepID=UPI0011180C81|nr:bifunctional DNA-formamidopyrimidine glycosylase/DNA-(apurinic or apyrimidinic site) lyase [Mycoplasmopsis pullorum]TNK81806.1 bifunctional DNA-formamidopyrimidine glycosylase/DNA-(apurinic or apyrimidinic site) lyase [Mycoplasmopsis pullorum]TNK82942.1 bifunctional DNA-formamidopyrimidine glycosylase/DNA-(apurinic or apyrimidinic site) lyase [Mycoplasmopsis pullorum]TNK84307.1 bifunctional DNA-formamidopyrimidine glycosylase/DNA-(apurinic or apyrimidinic site) lyase [Mycoplasmopsis pullorum]
MPEYPEVTVVTNTLNNLVSGRKIIKVEVRNNKFIRNVSVEEFVQQIQGRTIKNVQNFGKFIVFNFDTDLRMLSHLRMAGKFYVYDLELDKDFLFNLHNYVYFYLDNQKVMIYNDSRQFGGFELVDESDKRSIYEIKKLAQLPGDIDVDELYKKLQRKNISIKSVLLDQSLVLGIGNIYADEALFKSKIYPMTKCNQVFKKELAILLKNAQEIMDQSIKFGGSSVHTYQSVNSAKGTFQNQLRVYGRAGEVCLSCGKSNIIKVKLDFKANGRGTSYCPNCQKEV